MPTNNISLKAKSSKNNTVKVANFHGLPLQIVGFGVTPDLITDSLLNQPILETNLKGGPPRYVSIKTQSAVSYVFYKLPGVDQLFYSEISFWNAPEPNVPAQQLFAKASLQTNSLYTVQGNAVLFKKGNFNINKDIIIPVGYKVNIPAGTILNFARGAKFLSKSPIETFGKER